MHDCTFDSHIHTPFTRSSPWTHEVFTHNTKVFMYTSLPCGAYLCTSRQSSMTGFGVVVALGAPRTTMNHVWQHAHKHTHTRVTEQIRSKHPRNGSRDGFAGADKNCGGGGRLTYRETVLIRYIDANCTRWQHTAMILHTTRTHASTQTHHRTGMHVNTAPIRHRNWGDFACVAHAATLDLHGA